MTVLKRDKDACLPRLVKTKDDRVLTRAPCRIQIPERWVNVNLGEISDTTKVYGFFPIIFEDDVYTVMNVCAIMELTPSRTTKVTVEEESYYEFHFDENTPIIRTVNLIKQDTLTFSIIDEIIMKGKAPWWATVDDLCCILDTAEKHADSRIAQVPQTIEFMIGVIARKIEERSKPLRQTAKTLEDFRLDRIEFVAMRSVLHSVPNTVAKLSGAHFDDGVISAIVNPSTKASKVEKLLRT